MGFTKARNSRFSVFFNFSFLGEKWGTRNEKSIFFIFCPILAKIWQFLMIFQRIMVIVNIFLDSEAVLKIFNCTFLSFRLDSWTVCLWELQFGT